MRLRTVPLLALALCAACNGSTGGDASTDASDASDASDPSCGTLLGGPSLPLVISTSDYNSGALCAASAGASCTAPNLETLSGDTVLAWHDANTLVAMSSTDGRDYVSFYDVRVSPPVRLQELSAKLDGEANTGNPRGYFPISPHEGYAARFNQSALLRVNLADGTARRGPDLAPFRGAGAQPRPKHFARVGGELWLTLLRLDETQTNPTAPGAIALLDPTTDSVRDLDPVAPGTQILELPFANPVGPLSVRNGRVALACAGAYTRLDGGVLLVEGATHAVSVVVREDELDGNVDAAIWLDDDRLLLRVVGRTGGTREGELAIDSARLVEWSLRTRTAREWLRVNEWTLTEPVLGRDGLVYVGDRGDEGTRRPHGIRVFDARNGSERTRAPVPCALQPYDLLPEFTDAR